MRKIGLILFFILIYQSSAQDSLVNRSGMTGLSLNAGGPSLFASASIDFFIGEHVNIETGAGLFGYYYGFTLHSNGLGKSQSQTIYFGLYQNHFEIFGIKKNQGIKSLLGIKKYILIALNWP